jgi:Mrp family chromosome partitioning ATPase
MEELERRYDRVIYDSPPTSAVTDPTVIGGMADGVILVLRPGYTTRDAAGAARRQLADVRCRMLGVIMNRVDPDAGRYGYYYYSGRYYRYYGRYYSQETAKT